MKTGLWIHEKGTLSGRCSECGRICSEVDILPGGLVECIWNYCPICGAKMFDMGKSLKESEQE